MDQHMQSLMHCVLAAAFNAAVECSAFAFGVHPDTIAMTYLCVVRVL